MNEPESHPSEAALPPSTGAAEEDSDGAKLASPDDPAAAHLFFGPEAGERRRAEALAVLDSLTVEPIPGSAAGPAGRLFLRNVREQSLTIVEVEAGRATTVSLPELAPGDPPFNLIETGGMLVFYGGGATFALDPNLDGPPRSLGESWYFVPSAREGRVWLALLDPESPDTVRALRAVREVTVEGKVTVPDSGPPPSGNLVGAVADGLLFQEDGLEVWDPLTGEVTLRLPGPFPADTHGNLVAWCEYGCARLYLTDVGTRAEQVVSPTGSFTFEETYDGAFSPDGSLLAVPVVTESPPRHRVALVDVQAGTATVIAGSELAVDYPAMAWSPSGEWLFFNAGDGRIMAYRPGAERAIVLPVSVEQSFVDMAAS